MIGYQSLNPFQQNTEKLCAKIQLLKIQLDKYIGIHEEWFDLKVTTSKGHQNKQLSHASLNINCITLKLYSLFYSIIMNDYDRSLYIEQYIKDLTSNDRQKEIDIIDNFSLLNDKTTILLVSLIKHKGKIVNKNQLSLKDIMKIHQDSFKNHILNQVIYLRNQMIMLLLHLCQNVMYLIKIYYLILKRKIIWDYQENKSINLNRFFQRFLQNIFNISIKLKIFKQQHKLDELILENEDNLLYIPNNLIELNSLFIKQLQDNFGQSIDFGLESQNLSSWRSWKSLKNNFYSQNDSKDKNNIFQLTDLDNLKFSLQFMFTHKEMFQQYTIIKTKINLLSQQLKVKAYQYSYFILELDHLIEINSEHNYFHQYPSINKILEFQINACQTIMFSKTYPDSHVDSQDKFHQQFQFKLKTLRFPHNRQLNQNNNEHQEVENKQKRSISSSKSPSMLIRQLYSINTFQGNVKLIVFNIIQIALLFICLIFIKMQIVQQNYNVLQTNINYVTFPETLNFYFMKTTYISWIQLSQVLDLVTYSEFIQNQIKLELESLRDTIEIKLNELYKGIIQYEDQIITNKFKLININEYQAQLQQLDLTQFIQLIQIHTFNFIINFNNITSYKDILFFRLNMPFINNFAYKYITLLMKILFIMKIKQLMIQYKLL